jgi:hypothetical protein
LQYFKRDVGISSKRFAHVEDLFGIGEDVFEDFEWPFVVGAMLLGRR